MENIILKTAHKLKQVRWKSFPVAGHKASLDNVGKFYNRKLTNNDNNKAP